MQQLYSVQRTRAYVYTGPCNMAMNIQCSDKGSYNDAYTVLLMKFVKHLRVDTIILISCSAHPGAL